MEAYRSGHNEAVLKTVRVQAHGGSNPSASANKKRTFVYQKFSFCLSKPQAWHIISPYGAGYHHGNAVHLITRQRVFSCGLMIFNTLC